MADKADVIRKKIVATKEGGAITGEERLREFMDDLYGGILTYEGKPTATLAGADGASGASWATCRPSSKPSGSPM